MKYRNNKLIYKVITILMAGVLTGSCACSSPKQQEPVQETTGTQSMEMTGEEEHTVPASDIQGIVDVSQGNYVYQTLDTDTKSVYDQIVYAVENRAEAVTVSTLDTAVVEKAYHAVLADHSEYFWLDQLSYVTHTINDEVSYIDITPQFSMPQEEQDQYQAQIDATVDSILEEAPIDGSDYEKALYVYNSLINMVDYVSGVPNNQNIISAFVDHETVCQGYSYATQYLLKQLGIQCATVSGTANGQAHAWNLVKLDGEYYYLDTTWGNSQFTNGADGDSLKYITYEYFCVSSEELLRTHAFDDTEQWPECTSTDANYYVRQGLYIDSWDPDQIGAIIQNAFDSGAESVQMKMASDELYQQAMTYFLEDANIWSYCNGLTEINYMQSPDSRVFYLIF